MNIPNYHISANIYESPTSIIYRAHRAQDGQSVILKRLKTDRPTTEQLARFRREYEMTLMLKGDGIIQVYEFLPY